MEFEVGKLIESIGISVSEAQQGLENHALQRFLHYFEAASCRNPSPGNEPCRWDVKNILSKERETQVIEAAAVKILMPCEDDLSEKRVVEVPLVTLANHMQVQLDKVTVKVKARLFTDSAGSVRMDINAPVSNGMSSSEDSEDGGESGMIEMVFNVAGMSEGESRVVQNIQRVL